MSGLTLAKLEDAMRLLGRTEPHLIAIEVRHVTDAKLRRLCPAPSVGIFGVHGFGHLDLIVRDAPEEEGPDALILVYSDGRRERIPPMEMEAR